MLRLRDWCHLISMREQATIYSHGPEISSVVQSNPAIIQVVDCGSKPELHSADVRFGVPPRVPRERTKGEK